MIEKKRLFGIFITGLLLALLAGCGGRGHEGQTAHSASGAADNVFRIGYQKGGASNLLRLRGGLDKQFAAKYSVVLNSEFLSTCRVYYRQKGHQGVKQSFQSRTE